MSNNITLPEELQKQIEHDAASCTCDEREQTLFIAGATEYASKIHLLQQEYDKLKGENERLEAWKKSQMELTLPIIDWGQHNSALLPGDSIFQKVLEYAKGYEKLLPEHAALKEKAARMEKVLWGIKAYAATDELIQLYLEPLLSTSNPKANDNEM